MLTSGDVVLLDLGIPQGHEAGFPRPAVVVTAAKILKHSPSVVQIVPLTSTLRTYDSEVVIEADGSNGLQHDSAAQCQHVRSITASRIGATLGRISAVHLVQVREVLALLMDL